MKNQFKLSLIFFTVSLLIGCSDDLRIPAYLHDYQKEFKVNPKEANLKWFKDAKYGMFIHYGLYSILEKGEWVQLRDTIKVSEYAKLKDRFTAKNFNADEITDLALNGGMKYITITSKHHDGFCLFETKETDFNVMNSPAKRDLIKELYNACEQKGLGLFLYYSYGADWKHPYFYSRESGWSNARPAYTEHQPEYKFEKDADFTIYIDFVHEQLKEILSQYPNIAGIWFDPIMGYYSRPDLFPVDSTYALIRKMSPHALISFKQGANGEEDFMAPERGGGAKVGQQFDVAKIVYEKNKDKPREICNTLQPHAWGYNKKHDGNHKTADDIIKMLNDAKKSNANLLLNVGPKGDGSFPEEDVIAIKKAGKKLNEKKTYQLGQIKTIKGEMLFWLSDKTPVHKASFIKLANENYWDSLTFNRVIKDFVIQGGCPDTPEGFSDSPYLLKPEFNDSLKHIYGAVGAGRDNNPEKLSAGCQLYIVHAKNGLPRLDGDFMIFGQVFKGLDVLDAIASVETDSLDTPLTAITLDVNVISLTEEELREYGYDFPLFPP